jgi:hypothetical protein
MKDDICEMTEGRKNMDIKKQRITATSERKWLCG